MNKNTQKIVLLTLASVGVFMLFFVFKFGSSATQLQEDKTTKNYQRLVVLAPSSVEIVYDLGLGEKVVGVSSYTKYPADAVAKPKIGGYIDLDIEALLSLKPDCVVLLKERAALKQRLAKIGIDSVMLSHDSVNGVLESFRAVAEKFGVEALGKVKLDTIKKRIDKVKQRAKSLKKPRVLMILYRQSGSFHKMTIVGKKGFHRELLDLAGAKNAYTGEINFPQIGEEELIQIQPDYIIQIQSDESLSANEARQEWQGLKHLKAVKSGKAFIFNGSGHMIPGPRMVDTLEQLSDILYLGK